MSQPSATRRLLTAALLAAASLRLISAAARSLGNFSQRQAAERDGRLLGAPALAAGVAAGDVIPALTINAAAAR